MESESRHHLSWRDFLARRFWRLYKPILVINIITYLIYLAIGRLDYISLMDAIVSILGIYVLDGALWFVYVLLFCYLVFYIATLYDNAYYRYLILSIGCISLCAILALQYPLHYYISVPIFFVGVLLSEYKTWIMAHSYSIYYFCAIILICGVLTKYFCGNRVAVHIIINLMQTVLLVWLAVRFPIHIRYKSYLGKISYEVYLVHMKVLTIIIVCGYTISLWTYIPIVLFAGFGLHYLCNMKKILS